MSSTPSVYESERMTPDHAIALTTCSLQVDGPRHERGAAELTKEEEITAAGGWLRSLLALKKAEENAHILALQTRDIGPNGCTGDWLASSQLIADGIV